MSCAMIRYELAVLTMADNSRIIIAAATMSCSVRRDTGSTGSSGSCAQEPGKGQGTNHQQITFSIGSFCRLYHQPSAAAADGGQGLHASILTFYLDCY